MELEICLSIVILGKYTEISCRNARFLSSPKRRFYLEEKAIPHFLVFNFGRLNCVNEIKKVVLQ